MKTKSFTVRSRLASIRWAIEGIYDFIRIEHNARLHLVATIGVFVAAWMTGFTKLETCCLVFVTGMVWVTEIINTSIERMMDFLSPAKHQCVKQIKDLAAAAVLVSAFVAIITALLLFIPKFI